MRRLLLALSLLLVGFTPPQDSSPTYEVPSAPVLSIWSEEFEPVSQYYWDAATGSVNDWTMRVAGGTPSLAIVDDGGVQALRFRQSGGSNQRAAASFDLIANSADVEILTYVRSSLNGTTTQLAHWGRGAGSTSANITGLVSNKYIDAQRGLQLFRYLNGAFANYTFNTTGADASLTDVTLYHWRKTQISGTTFRSKAWAGLVTDEPAAWGRQVTQSEITASGWAGLVAFEVLDNFYQIFSIGINGSPAPTEPLASGVTLTAPADTTTQTQPITFSWEAEAGATAYQLQIATDSAFNTIVHDDDTLTTTSKEVSGLAADTLHYWRVRADI